MLFCTLISAVVVWMVTFQPAFLLRNPANWPSRYEPRGLIEQGPSPTRGIQRKVVRVNRAAAAVPMCDAWEAGWCRSKELQASEDIWKLAEWVKRESFDAEQAAYEEKLRYEIGYRRAISYQTQIRDLIEAISEFPERFRDGSEVVFTVPEVKDDLSASDLLQEIVRLASIQNVLSDKLADADARRDAASRLEKQREQTEIFRRLAAQAMMTHMEKGCRWLEGVIHVPAGSIGRLWKVLIGKSSAFSSSFWSFLSLFRVDFFNLVDGSGDDSLFTLRDMEKALVFMFLLSFWLIGKQSSKKAAKSTKDSPVSDVAAPFSVPKVPSPVVIKSVLFLVELRRVLSRPRSQVAPSGEFIRHFAQLKAKLRDLQQRAKNAEKTSEVLGCKVKTLQKKLDDSKEELSKHTTTHATELARTRSEVRAAVTADLQSNHSQIVKQLRQKHDENISKAVNEAVANLKATTVSTAAMKQAEVAHAKEVRLLNQELKALRNAKEDACKIASVNRDKLLQTHRAELKAAENALRKEADSNIKDAKAAAEKDAYAKAAADFVATYQKERAEYQKERAEYEESIKKDKARFTQCLEDEKAAFLREQHRDRIDFETRLYLQASGDLRYSHLCQDVCDIQRLLARWVELGHGADVILERFTDMSMAEKVGVAYLEAYCSAGLRNEDFGTRPDGRHLGRVAPSKLRILNFTEELRDFDMTMVDDKPGMLTVEEPVAKAVDIPTPPSAVQPPSPANKVVAATAAKVPPVPACSAAPEVKASAFPAAHASKVSAAPPPAVSSPVTVPPAAQQPKAATNKDAKPPRLQQCFANAVKASLVQDAPPPRKVPETLASEPKTYSKNGETGRKAGHGTGSGAQSGGKKKKSRR